MYNYPCDEKYMLDIIFIRYTLYALLAIYRLRENVDYGKSFCQILLNDFWGCTQFIKHMLSSNGTVVILFFCGVDDGV